MSWLKMPRICPTARLFSSCERLSTLRCWRPRPRRIACYTHSSQCAMPRWSWLHLHKVTGANTGQVRRKTALQQLTTTSCNWFPSYTRAALISDSVGARHQLKLQDQGYGASILHGVPVYHPAYASTKLCCLVTSNA